MLDEEASWEFEDVKERVGHGSAELIRIDAVANMWKDVILLSAFKCV